MTPPIVPAADPGNAAADYWDGHGVQSAAVFVPSSRRIRHHDSPVGVAARGVLFGVTPTDPATYLAVFAILSTASVAASYLPAWRAARINVVEALRQE